MVQSGGVTDNIKNSLLARQVEKNLVDHVGFLGSSLARVHAPRASLGPSWRPNGLVGERIQTRGLSKVGWDDSLGRSSALAQGGANILVWRRKDFCYIHSISLL